jgi:hypothetical protein
MATLSYDLRKGSLEFTELLPLPLLIELPFLLLDVRDRRNNTIMLIMLTVTGTGREGGKQ